MPFLPHRRLNILTLTLGAALVAASCGVSRDVANSTAAAITFSDGSTAEISSDDIEPVVSSIQSNDEFVALIYPDGDTSGLEADVLTQAIGAELITHAADSAGATVDDEAVAEGATAAEAELESALVSQDTGGSTEGLDDYFQVMGRVRGAITALQEALATEAPCVSHILVETEDEADDLYDQLGNGADFAELATEFSTDPGSGAQGGALGCVSVDQWVPEFADAVLTATEGEVTEPVQSQFGYHLILVTGTEPGTGEAEAQAAVQAEVAEMTVEVDPAIGTWADGRVIAAGSES